MNPLQIGVIGCGYWGPNLIRNFVELPNAEVVVVADIAETRLAAIKARYPGVTVTPNYQECFAAHLDAVVVATPPHTHYPIARECLEHGLHVLLEKPMTLSCWEAEQLIELAERQDLTLMVGHTFEYNPAVHALKALIDSGEFGQIYYVDAVRANLGLYQARLNVIWDLAPHDISILRYILGGNPTHVSACGTSCIVDGNHDLAYLYLEYPNGVVAHVHVSWLDPCKVRRFTIVGSRKMAIYDDIEPLEKIKIYDKGVEKPAYTDTFGEFQLSYRYGDVVIPYIQFAEPLRLECQHFIDSIQNHTPPQSSGRVGLDVVRVLETAQTSLQHDGRLEAVPDSKEQVHDYLYSPGS